MEETYIYCYRIFFEKLKKKVYIKEEFKSYRFMIFYLIRNLVTFYLLLCFKCIEVFIVQH